MPRRDGWYNLGHPFPVDRACAPPKLDGAHVEYFRGIRNPIGIKVGPTMTGEWLLELLEMLDPETSRAGSP